MENAIRIIELARSYNSSESFKEFVETKMEDLEKTGGAVSIIGLLLCNDFNRGIRC
jgi:hypothetical protein